MIGEVIARLATQRFVLIHGSSGSGKSSLVRAGVLPELARQHLRVGASWRVCSMRPSGGPLWNLAREFAQLEGHTEDAARADRALQIVGLFNRREATLSGVASSLTGLRGQRICILIDQFEELFRFEKETSRTEAELFINLLVRSDFSTTASHDDAIKPDENVAAVHVIVTMRSEFLGECARFDGLPETINRTQYLVPRMDRDGLIRAIRRPAELYGGEIARELTDRLTADVAGHEDELPLIQHGLMCLWNAAVARGRPENKIVLEAGQLAAAGGLSKLLSDHANSVVDEVAVDSSGRDAVERLFRALIDLNVEGQAIRRPQAFRNLAAVTQIGDAKLREIIDAMRRDGVSFLTPYPPLPISEGTPIDISHEALIRCWGRLADLPDGWLKREFDDGLIWRSLLVQAKSFEVDKRRILSPATIEERYAWWQDRKVNAPWAERYGGNFSRVEKLMSASRRSAAWKRRRQYALIGVLSLIGLIGIAYALWKNQARLDVLADIYFRRTVLSTDQEKALKPQDVFQECSNCPTMVVVAPSAFTMGSPDADPNHVAAEGPQRTVTILSAFAISKFELTFDKWDACHDAGGCTNNADAYTWGRGQQPVINVSWDDAKQYVAWLSRETGKDYRLLTEAEWEYAERAGTQTAYYWGDVVGTGNANCDGCGSRWDNSQSAPVGSFAPNALGLYDTAGNVWEWVEDCWHETYDNAPKNGSAWTTQVALTANGDCLRVARGGAWFYPTSTVRSAARTKYSHIDRYPYVGFRVARTLGP
jgi:formylglycine-generating enzyme required for sulfatase activity/energy-coupling factor transporter ATP-binding protein EcfA2